MSSINMLALVEACMCTNVRKLSRVITRLYDKQLEPSGININQLGILLTIQGMSDLNGESPTIGEVADRMVMEASTLSRALRVMENSGLIKLRMNKKNRKKKVVLLTERGIDTVFEAYGYWDQMQEQVRQKMGGEDFDALLGMLINLEKAIEKIDL